MVHFGQDSAGKPIFIRRNKLWRATEMRLNAFI
jgi:hypothetical protein